MGLIQLSGAEQLCSDPHPSPYLHLNFICIFFAKPELNPVLITMKSLAGAQLRCTGKLCIFLLLTLITINCQSQSSSIAQEAYDQELLNKIRATAETRFKTTLSHLDKNFREDLTEIYNLRWQNITEHLDKKEIFTSRAAQEYLDKIVFEITSKNPVLLGSQFNCYFSRSGVPNASYLGEGIVLINIGLVHRLKNESQLAFVIAHEIAHLYLEHSDNAIKTYVEKINSKVFQDELLAIKGSTYGKRHQLEKLVTNLSFSNRRHTRQNETTADSFALALITNTSFMAAESLTTLALLEHIDKDSINISQALATIFDSKEYPFQNKWLRKEEGLLSGHAKLVKKSDDDSLKTHPDCQNRIDALTVAVQAHQQNSSEFMIDAVSFETLRKRFHYEVVKFSYESKNYSRSLFQAIQLLEIKPADPLALLEISKSLSGIYDALKMHRLSRETDLPAPHQSAEYNTLCQFIQNSYSENVAALNYHFLLKYKNRLSGEPTYQKLFIEAEKNHTN